MQGETLGGRSNPSERAMQAVEEQARTIRADCQMRFGNGETFGAEKANLGVVATSCWLANQSI